MSAPQRPTYRLVLHDDDDHTFEYVIHLLKPVLGVSTREAFELAWKVHDAGRAEVGFLELPTAREVEERLLSGGPDPRLVRSKTSLAVSLEEVSGSSVRVLSRGRVGASGYERLEEADLSRLHETRRPPGAALASPDPFDRACGVADALRFLVTIIVLAGLFALLARAIG